VRRKRNSPQHLDGDDNESLLRDDGTFTYFIQAGPDGPVKIGIADDVEKRLKELQTGCPHDLRIIGRIKGNVESRLHEIFDQFRLRGEWFSPDIRLMAFIVEHAESCGKVEALVLAAESVVKAFDGVRDEIHEMWFQVIANTPDNGVRDGYGMPVCRWPHVRAFDDGVHALRRAISQLAR
jgi:hypothetical protein